MSGSGRVRPVEAPARRTTSLEGVSPHSPGRERPRLAAVPTEPSEASGLSAPPSVPGRLCGDDDGSVGRDETEARVRALGIGGPLYKSFPCVLPEHDHQARVHPTTAGFWQYHCEGLDSGIGLGEVRACLAYGREYRPSALEAARWHERLDFEAHLRYPVPLDVWLPEPCPEAARIVAGKMRVFVGLRDARFPLHEPFVFAREFAKAYCNLSADKIRAALSWLERSEVIYRAGLNGRSILWKLVAQDEYVTRRSDGGR
jgi:hypothetical protein